MVRMLSMADFEKVETEGGKYYYCHVTNSGLEVCLELCFAGFDVAVYRNYGEGGYDLAVPKRCTNTSDYTGDIFNYRRTDKDKLAAIDIANKILMALSCG